AARRTNAGINHRDVNRVRRKVVITRAERERSGSDVLRRNLVRQVNDLCLRIEAENDAFDGGDKVIGSAEVGEQGNHSIAECGLGIADWEIPLWPIKIRNPQSEIRNE